MRVALIPPTRLIPLLPVETICKDEYYMVIPAGMKYLQYSQLYSNTLRKNKATGKLTILDNGAAEGEQLDPDTLHQVAEQVNAQEIVIPDVLGDAVGTQFAVTQFEKDARKPAAILGGRSKMMYMGVVQGTTYDEIRDMLKFYNAKSWITTIGVPRILLSGLGLDARMRVLNMIEHAYGKTRWGVHLLGASPQYPQECVAINHRYPWVRGIDTSMPFVYARYGCELTNHKYIPRNPDFWDYFWDDSEIEMAINNSDRFRRWAQNASS